MGRLECSARVHDQGSMFPPSLIIRYGYWGLTGAASRRTSSGQWRHRHRTSPLPPNQTQHATHIALGSAMNVELHVPAVVEEAGQVSEAAAKIV